MQFFLDSISFILPMTKAQLSAIPNNTEDKLNFTPSCSLNFTGQEKYKIHLCDSCCTQQTCTWCSGLQSSKGCWEMATKCPGLTAKHPSTPRKLQHDKLWVCSVGCLGGSESHKTKTFWGCDTEKELGIRWGESPKPDTTAPHMHPHTLEKQSYRQYFPMFKWMREKNLLWQAAFWRHL